MNAAASAATKTAQQNDDDAKERTSETTLEPAKGKKHQKTSGEYFLGSLIQT